VSYRLQIAPAAARQLRGLPRKVLERVDVRILALATEPRPPGARHLEGDLYRIRVGNIRVVYTVSDTIRVVLIVAAADRKEVYRLLKRMGYL
jgi:mRNA interferase RelE/StbE